MEACKLLGVESFYEYIGDVVVGIDVIKCNFLGLDAFMKEMMFDVDVFDAIVECRVFGKIYCGVVVT